MCHCHGADVTTTTGIAACAVRTASPTALCHTCSAHEQYAYMLCHSHDTTTLRLTFKLYHYATVVTPTGSGSHGAAGKRICV